MEILITSKTHKGKAACVGGMVISNNRFVRLLNPGNWDQYADTDFDIGDIWEISFSDRQDVEPPHIEDIIISTKKFLRKVDNFTNFIENSGIQIFRGSPNNIFNGLLGWTGSGSGYIGNRNNLPQNSVGFWISDKDLALDDDEKHYIYPSPNAFSRAKRFPYVGFEPKRQMIPSGTLMRISLARWWKPEDSDMNERCYLQLSGWYNVQNTDQCDDDENDDLPF
ncbi:MAG: hypothetical protein R2863_11730 [Candidatus Kapaibacterium sp.]